MATDRMVWARDLAEECVRLAADLAGAGDIWAVSGVLGEVARLERLAKRQKRQDALVRLSVLARKAEIKLARFPAWQQALQDGLSEADTRAKLIDPVLHRLGWGEDRIRREVAGADYALLTVDGRRVLAVLEAKREGSATDEGLAQAWEYAGEVGADWAFSTNGRGFAGVRRRTRVRMEGRLTEFPGPGVLEPQIPLLRE